MISERINLFREGEYAYPDAYGFMPNMVSCIHDEDERIRPCLLVVPGGGYRVVSPTEGGIVAEKFYAKDYNAFVLTYTTNLLDKTPLRRQPLSEIARAVRLLRKHAAEYRIDGSRVITLGFSAGAHLCGSLGVHWDDVRDPDPELDAFSARADAMVLSYPVITAGNEAHRDSFTALLGRNPANEDLSYMSLEKHVTEKTPPCFLWQTVTDTTVPVTNSLIMAQALIDHHVRCALHLFSSGRHGLSLADAQWASGEYGEPYTMEQTMHILSLVKNGTISLPEEMRKSLLDRFDPENRAERSPLEPNREVSIWPDLADAWIREVLGRCSDN